MLILKRIEQIRKDIEKRGENWERTPKTGSRRAKTARDFSVNLTTHIFGNDLRMHCALNSLKTVFNPYN